MPAATRVLGSGPASAPSPRKAAISLYGLQDSPDSAPMLERLGKHRLGKGCVYVNGLKDIDEGVLRELIAAGWATDPEGC